jgi:hypothetical protein
MAGRSDHRDADGFWLKLPIPPAAIAEIKKHMEAGARIAELAGELGKLIAPYASKLAKKADSRQPAANSPEKSR